MILANFVSGDIGVKKIFPEIYKSLKDQERLLKCLENSKQSIEIDKARETTVVENDYVSFEHGNYFYVEIPATGITNIIPSFHQHESLQLLDSTSSILGQLKFKLIDFDEYDTITNNAIYKLYFYDLEMNTDPIVGGKYNVSNIFYFRKVGSASNSFRINDKSRIIDPLPAGSNKTFISEPKPNSLIFDASEKSIKQTNNFKYMTSISKTLNHVSNSLTFSLDPNEKFASEFTGITRSGLRDSLIDKYLIVLNKDSGVRYDNLSITTTTMTSN